MPTVSVIVPAYNAGQTIERCVRSVLDQTLDDLELIVVDDGSTDDTAEKAREAFRQDRRALILSQPNAGAGAARNAGMAEASGEFLYFLDADDWAVPDALAILVGAIERAHADIAVCRSTSVDAVSEAETPIDFGILFLNDDAVLTSTEVRRSVFQSFVGWPWDKLFRASFARGQGLEFQELRTSNDARFVFLALALATEVVTVPDRLVFHSTNNSSSLEGSRSRSWDNAARAALAIEQELKARDAYEAMEQSFLEWLLHFSVWNYLSLDGEARDGLLGFIRTEVAPRLGHADPDGFRNPRERTAAKLIKASDSDALLPTILEVAELVQSQEYQIENLQDQLTRGREEFLKEEEDKRDAALERLYRNFQQELQEKLGAKDAEIAALKNSLSFRVGRAATAVPRALRDSVTGQ